MTLTTGTDPSALVATVPTSVCEAVGGRPALVAAVDNFYGRLVEDPVLGPFFHGRVGKRHRRYVVTILAEALCGPERYRGPDIGGAHQGLGISDAHFDRAAAHLVATLADLGVLGHLAERIVGVVAGARPAVVIV